MQRYAFCVKVVFVIAIKIMLKLKKIADSNLE